VTLTFTHNGHRYQLDGDKADSVTTVCGVLPKGDGLVWWAADIVARAVADQASTVDALRSLGREPMVAALRSLPDQAKKTAGARGTLVHELSTGLVKGEPVELDLIADPDIEACLYGLRRWFDLVGFEAHLIERPVGNRAHTYAGRFDVVGTMAADRSQRWLIDFKTSKGVYGDTALQTAAYARAEFYLGEDGTSELPMPYVDRIGVLHVQPDLTELYDLGDIDVAFEEFLAAQTIYRTGARRRDLVAAPLSVATVRAL
jgi:hypothetical protein